MKKIITQPHILAQDSFGFMPPLRPVLIDTARLNRDILLAAAVLFVILLGLFIVWYRKKLQYKLHQSWLQLVTVLGVVIILAAGSLLFSMYVFSHFFIEQYQYLG